MKAKEFNPYIEQGTDWIFYGQCLNPDGTAFDLTNWVGRAQLRDATNSAVVIAELPVVPVEPAATSGYVMAELDAATSSAITVNGRTYKETRSFTWDLEIENSVTGRVLRLFNGIAQMSPECTKPATP